MKRTSDLAGRSVHSVGHSLQSDGLSFVTILSSDADIDRLVNLLEAIAREEGWQSDGALHAHRDQSIYFGLYVSSIDSEPRELIGGLQLVLPDLTGAIPSQLVWPELQIDQAHLNGVPQVAHIAVMAVALRWRGVLGMEGGLFWNLAAQMWRHCVLIGVKAIYLEATPRTLRCYQRMGWPLTICGELRSHFGEPCYLTLMTVREVGGALTERAVRSAKYRSIVLKALD